MYVVREILDETLAGFLPHGLRPQYSYFTKPIKYKDTEVFQVFFGNWTVHWQLSWHGEEEFDEQERYGDLTEMALISLDIEAAGRKVPRIGKLQRHVLEGISDVAAEILPDAEVKLLEHHLIWETIEFNPYDSDSVCAAANCLSTHIKALAVPAIDAALKWADSGGFEMQSMHPLLRAS
jgi:hypothetical protein